MEKLALIFLLFLTPCTWGQSNDSTFNSKIDVGFSFSPDYSYRTLKAEATDNWMKDYYDTLEVSRFGYTAGLNTVVHLNGNFRLGIGLLFSDKGEKTKKYDVRPVNNYINHYYYLSVPVKANYYLINKKIKLFLTAGLSADIYLSGQSNVETLNAGEKKVMGLSSKISRMGLSLIGGAGIDCDLTDRWYFKLEPVYRRSVTPLSNSPVKKYFYSAGLNIGFFCKL